MISYKALEKALDELTIEQIQEVEETFKKKYPYRSYYRYLCGQAIEKKREQSVRSDFMDIVKSIKNAPDGAGTPSQGNETR